MNQFTIEQQALLSLVRRSLWEKTVKIPAEVNWETVDASAKAQAMISFAYDGAVKMKADVPEEILQKWKNKMLQGVVNNERLMMAQDELVAWFEQAGIPAVILKGSSVGRYYPQPGLRVLGDIDILVRETDLEKAGEILKQHGYVFHEADHGFHLSFGRRGVHVELHYNVTGFPDSEGGRNAKKEADCFLDHVVQGNVSEHIFPVLSESDQALSLLLHMIRHMFENGIGLRQLLDWAMFAACADSECFASETIPMLERCGLLQYAKVATRACVQYLGLPDSNISWCEDISDEESRMFIQCIFNGGNMGQADQDSMGSLFTDSKTMGAEKTAFKALISRLNGLAYKHFPFTKKYKVFLPFFWIFLPARYMVRSWLGLRPKKSLKKVVGSAKRQRSLYEMVRPFEVE